MKPLKKFAALLFCFFLIIPSALAQEGSGPTLWSLSDDDTTIYIFGTIHILNKEVEWATPKVQNAFDGSDALVMELAPDQGEDAVMTPLVAKYGMLTGGQTLQTILSEDEHASLAKLLAAMGAPGNALDTMQPWLAAIFLTVQGAATHGFLPDYGVEAVLEKNAVEKGMPIFGLETAEFQISILAGLSMENQRLFLSLTLEEMDQIEEVFIAMRDAWVTGDLEALDAIVNQDLDVMPGFAEAILYQRNRNWVGDLTELMDTPGQYFVAVGTGHLVGINNLISLLQKAGLEVKKE
jgi:uncharacterized protein